MPRRPVHALGRTAIIAFTLASPCFGQEDVDVRYRAGLGLLQRGLHQEAMVELRAHLDSQPQAASEATARYSLSICLVRLGDLAAAARELDVLLPRRDFPFAADALFLRAQCAVGLDRHDEAITLLERLDREQPTFAQRDAAGSMRVDALARVGRGTDCAEAADLLLARKPPAPLAARVACVAAGAAAASGDDLAATRLYRASLAAQPDGPCAATSRLGEAQALHRLGRLEEALRSYEAIAVGGSESADIARWAAGCESAMGRFDEAAIRLERALATATKPADIADLRFERFGALERSKDAARCAIAAREFAERHPSDPRASTASRIAVESLFASGDFAGCDAASAAFLQQHAADPDRSRVAVLRGLALARLARPRDARAALAEALACGVPDPALRRSALATAVDLAYEAGDWTGTQSLCQELIPLTAGTPDEPEALLRAAMAVRRSGEPDRSLAGFDRILAEHPGSEAAQSAAFERAQALIELDRLDLAKAALRLVLDRWSQDPRTRSTSLCAMARSQWAAIALRQGDLEEASRALAGSAEATLVDLAASLLAANRPEDAEATLDRFLTASPTDARAPEAAARRAIALARQGRGDADQALAMAAGDPRLPPALQASVRYERALRLFAAERPDEAMSLLAAIEADEEAAGVRPYAALELARRHIERGEHQPGLDRIAASLSHASTLAPAEQAAITERAIALRGLCELRFGDAAKAAATLAPFSDRLASSPLATDARLIRAEALVASGRAAEAVPDLEAVVAAKPGPAVLEPALLRLGEAHAAAQRWQESLAAFALCRQSFPDSQLWFQARFGEAWAMEQSGRAEAALAAYRDVAAKHKGPTAARAQFQIGECLFGLTRFDDAVREYMKVDLLHAEPQWSAAALYEAGQCLIELGRRDDASKRFDEVIERFGATRWAELARERRARLLPAALPGRG